jgi:hypothetical protein
VTPRAVALTMRILHFTSIKDICIAWSTIDRAWRRRDALRLLLLTLPASQERQRAFPLDRLSSETTFARCRRWSWFLRLLWWGVRVWLKWKYRIMRVQGPLEMRWDRRKRVGFELACQVPLSGDTVHWACYNKSQERCWKVGQTSSPRQFCRLCCLCLRPSTTVGDLALWARGVCRGPNRSSRA